MHGLRDLVDPGDLMSYAANFPDLFRRTAGSVDKILRFAAGKKALVAEDSNGAIAALKRAALGDPRNADNQNYIGYAYRRLRRIGASDAQRLVQR
jgi:Flp pilus assembly protein TadD